MVYSIRFPVTNPPSRLARADVTALSWPEPGAGPTELPFRCQRPEQVLVESRVSEYRASDLGGDVFKR